MGLFIALDFGELRAYFINLQGLLPKNAGLSLAREFHLTLKFLGEVQDDELMKIISALKNVKFRVSSFFIDSLGTFSAKNKLKVVWAGLGPKEEILELQKAIEYSLKGLFKKEKEFKAHITLARVNYIKDKKSFLNQLKKINVGCQRADIHNFKLIKSTLTPKGAFYEDIAIFNAK